MKKAKQILYKEKARNALVNGMMVMVKAVSATLGPKGRNVVLEKKYSSPQIINDGVSIAKEIELLNNIQNTGISLIRQAALKTNEVAGDGTTTATVLAYAIVKEGMKNLVVGANPVSLKIGLEKALQFLLTQIYEFAIPVETLASISNVAAIASGNDPEIGKMITNALEKVGKNGLISLDEGRKMYTELELSEGMRFDKGFFSDYFITNADRMDARLENPYVLVTEKKISLSREDLIPILEKIILKKKSLVIIAPEIDSDPLQTLVVNNLRNVIRSVAVRAPSFGQRRKAILQDIAIFTQAHFISEDSPVKLENLLLDQLGEATRVTVTKDRTTIINSKAKNFIQQHCEKLRNQIKLTDDSYEKEQLQDRIARLSGGIAVIKVGAPTETEMKDKKLRIEDAINATRAAVEEGIVPGGGVTFVHLAESLKEWSKLNLREDELLGGLILAKAITAPLRRIAENAGKNSSVIIEKIEKANFNIGYNAMDDSYGDMYSFGIVDPAKVTRSAIQNATSIAAMILTTECIVVDK